MPPVRKSDPDKVESKTRRNSTKCRKAELKRLHQIYTKEYRDWLETTDFHETDHVLYNLLKLEDPTEMVRSAYEYRSVTNNISLTEWSEAVLLQLCNIHVKMTFDDLLWADVQEILRSQWNPMVYNSTVLYLGPNRSLGMLFKQNRRKKIKMGFTKDKTRFFSTKPCVNYACLVKYVSPSVNQ